MKKFLLILSISTLIIANVSVLIHLRIDRSDFVRKNDLEKLRLQTREDQDTAELYWNDIESRLENRVKSLEDPHYKDGRPAAGRIYQAISPDGYYVVRTYFNDPESSVKLLRVGESVEKLLYQSERITYPPFWVGNDHVAFYTKCGSSCQGTMLIDVKRGRLMTGVVSYMVPKSGETEWETIFKDWFGKIHKYKGLWGNMYGESVDGVDYVVLYETDERGAVTQEQKLRFLGDKLI
ncbi:hypothetical protein COT50_00180 [candidate division WWE3 bacterium CG08_land_8_20_14_0_20_41_10]|uniref:Uncharacterized protein n=1 Tax=candidate division WWE3 bacterium CG08_land_8_20_14_0_20_41_10 TaxID=1975085 RepID=A0A2H0XD49_UNCKA|nr:MAG: hypothetical protein COT50_00180 [candidate division WWE3 bacterium CG08_land_8_20_14_0_20_41_10]